MRSQSAQDLVDHLSSLDTRELEVQALEFISERVMLDSKQMEHGGMQIMYGADFL